MKLQITQINTTPNDKNHSLIYTPIESLTQLIFIVIF
jgi:hypothetical protein